MGTPLPKERGDCVVKGRGPTCILLDHSQNPWVHLIFWLDDLEPSSKNYNGLFPIFLLSRVNCVTDEYISSLNECPRCSSLWGRGRAVGWGLHTHEQQAPSGARWNQVWKGKKGKLWISSLFVGSFCWNPLNPVFLDYSLICQVSMKLYISCQKIHVSFNS